MKNQTTFLIFALILLFNQAIGQTFKQQFNKLVSDKDSLGQVELLSKWEASDSNDPELYVAYFNYYVNLSKKEILEIGNNPPEGEEVLQVMDNDTSSKDPIGYIYSNTYYDPDLLQKGFDYADMGISKNPSRLDIRFGKAYMYGELENWEDFTSEIIKTIEYSASIKNNWTWTDNKAVEDPKEFMLGAIQGYQIQLYDTEDDELLDNMKQIAEEVLKYYPDHVESLSNLSIVYILKENYEPALEALLKAEKLAPTDYVVLSNIAQAYKLKGDNKNAIKYYKLTIKHGDERAKEFSKQQIEELKKK
ncbi:MAG: hypothetical protein K9J13_08500 [Saprospiraceae bacterium]|nr:hypothetical protein [Saprospiraceae bacterium]